jgi:two-component system chemotaxis response regulator CheY
VKKVLLIDDDKVSNFLSSLIIKKTLKAEVIKECLDGQEGIDYLKTLVHENGMPDILFLDLNMPVLDGWQFLQEFGMLEKKIKMPIYILTSSNYEGDLIKSKEFDVVKGYIVKPLSKELAESIFNQL